MRVRVRNALRKPRGKTLVLVCIMLPAIMGFMALAVDISIIAASQGQLNTVADAAALAGAAQLADDRRLSLTLTDISPEISAAMSAAKNIGQDNRVLTRVPVFEDNSSNSASGDIVVGYMDPATHQWTAPPAGATLAMANSVMVTAQRNSTHGGLVPAFFSRTWGYPGTAVTFTAIATAQNYPIGGFKGSTGTSSSTSNAGMLPIVLDSSTWQDMMTQSVETTDNYAFDSNNYNPPSSNGVSLGSDGVRESVIYPVGTDPGNWGTVNIGISNNSTSTLSSQIMYGLTPQQLATFPNSTLSLDNTQDPPSLTLSGNPGISAGLQSALTSIIGKAVTIPIYDQVSGVGANVTYRVIAFQACRIMAVNFQGTPKYVVIQPALVRDPTAVPITNTSQWPPNWNWTSGGVVRLHLTR